MASIMPAFAQAGGPTNPNANETTAYQLLQQGSNGGFVGGATVELDQKVYTWTDLVHITVVVPSCNTHPNIVDIIGYVGSCGTISIKTSKGQLNSYSLIETGPNTGVFTGYVTLTGFPNYDAKGDGTGHVSGITNGIDPTNGQIATSSNDNIQVTFTRGSSSITGSALIRWNIGEVSWLQTNYQANGQGILQIVDPDMNLNPNAIDKFNTNVFSGSDPNGINLTMIETSPDTGIFQGTVYFTTNSQSSGNMLHVSEGDIVTGNYIDRTLPPPWTLSSQLHLTATTVVAYTVPPPQTPTIPTPPVTNPNANEIDMTVGTGSSRACVAANNCFSPNTLSVVSGTTVTWKNTDTVSHYVTSGNPSDTATGTVFDSGNLIKPGGTYQFTFANAGTYNYFCTVHPWMVGQVIVGTSVLNTPSNPITSPPLDQTAMCNNVGGANVQLDKQVYTPNDIVSITVVVPACNTDPNVVDIIGDGTRGTITISTNSAKLGNYQLIETGPNTGVFTGKVALYETKMTQYYASGKGPTDGMIGTLPTDNISVSFTRTSGFGTVTGSALIRSSYNLTQTAGPSNPNVNVTNSYQLLHSNNQIVNPSTSVFTPTQQDIQNINQAKANQTIAAEVNVGASQSTTTSIDNSVSVQTTTNTPDSLNVNVSAPSQTGPKVIAFNLNTTTINVANLNDLGVMYDGKLIQPAPNMDAILHAKPTDNPSFAIVVTQSGVQILVLVPHFSTHSITIMNMSKGIPAVPEFGSLAGMIITISIVGILTISRKVRFHF